MADSAGDAARVGADPFVGVVCPLLVVVETSAAGPAGDGADGGGGAGDAGDAASLGGAGHAGRGGDADGGGGQVTGRGHGGPDTANRCAASDPPAPVSLAQQRLVCLEADHVDCPRYVRAMGSGRGGPGRLSRPASTRSGLPVAAGVASTAGRANRPSTAAASVGAAESSVADPRLDPPTSTLPAVASHASAAAIAPASVVPVAPVVRSTRRSGARPARSRPGPTVLAVGILVAALVVAFAFTSYRGGLTLPGAPPSLESAGPSPIPSQAVSPSPTPAPSPTPTASLTPTPSPTPSLSPAPTPSGTPGPSVPPAFVGLKPCPDAPDCYLYRVRSGDNLTRIAERFGVTTAAIRTLNPEITDPSLLHVGDMIRIPLPTG